jgi:predicted RNA-binding Zn-ribbon protein involved in translation (DUF1610 family)
MRERIDCPDCGIEMDFHPVTKDDNLMRADLGCGDNLLGGILDEFYSCPECGRTAIPNEIYAEQTVLTYRWNLVSALEIV